MIKEKRAVIAYKIDGEFYKEYESISLASKDIKVSACSITNCCRKNQKSAGGYVWKYKDTAKHIKEPKSFINFSGQFDK